MRVCVKFRIFISFPCDLLDKSMKFGSLSNVGVRIQREQNPRPEGTEVSEPEGDPLERLNCIVATLGKPIGLAKIESVEYVGLPVDQRLAAGFEFGKIESVAGIEPEVETLQRGRAVGGRP